MLFNVARKHQKPLSENKFKYINDESLFEEFIRLYIYGAVSNGIFVV